MTYLYCVNRKKKKKNANVGKTPGFMSIAQPSG